MRNSHSHSPDIHLSRHVALCFCHLLWQFLFLFIATHQFCCRYFIFFYFCFCLCFFILHFLFFYVAITHSQKGEKERGRRGEGIFLQVTFPLVSGCSYSCCCYCGSSSFGRQLSPSYRSTRRLSPHPHLPRTFLLLLLLLTAITIPNSHSHSFLFSFPRCCVLSTRSPDLLALLLFIFFVYLHSHPICLFACALNLLPLPRHFLCHSLSLPPPPSFSLSSFLLLLHLQQKQQHLPPPSTQSLPAESKS